MTQRARRIEKNEMEALFAGTERREPSKRDSSLRRPIGSQQRTDAEKSACFARNDKRGGGESDESSHQDGGAEDGFG